MLQRKGAFRVHYVLDSHISARFSGTDGMGARIGSVANLEESEGSYRSGAALKTAVAPNSWRREIGPERRQSPAKLMYSGRGVSGLSALAAVVSENAIRIPELR